MKQTNKNFWVSIFPLSVSSNKKSRCTAVGLMRNGVSYLPSLSFVFYLLFFACSISSFSQETKKPKIGLVLSGGGAKGFAHIGVLKEIEKAGIKLDYIGGTSMGAVIGGLYACGYSADELDSIFKGTDFDELLQDFVPRNNKTFYEKRNDEVYAFSLPFQRFKVSVPKGISKGLYNYNLLSKLTHNYRYVRDFNQLKIPFICIATNVETGEEKIFRNGSLPLVLSASGAFPSLFSPVEIDGKLYIDGGVANNYPVEEVRRMGADIIIGVDVQDGLKNRDKLTGATGVLVQISNFQMIEKMNEKRKLTDIYIKPDIEGFSVVSFAQGQEIIKRGVEAALLVKAQLDRIGSSEAALKPIQKANKIDSVFIKEVAINSMKNYTRSYVLGKLRFKTGKKISYNDLHSGINNLNATQNFSSIDYSIIKDDYESDVLSMSLKENPIKTYLKLGLHYDDLYKSSALINVSQKNLFFSNDIASLDFVLGDNFRYNFDYYRDNGFHWSFGAKSRLNRFNKRQSKTDFRGGDVISALSLKTIDLDYSDLTNQVYVQTIFAQKFLVGGGLEQKYINIKSNNFQDEASFIEDSNYFAGFAFLKYDSFNNKYFPKRGWYFFADAQSFVSSSDYNNDFTKHSIFKADVGIAQTFFKKATIKIQSEGGFCIGENANDIFNFSLGGYGFSPVNNIKPFYGYDFLSLSGDSYVKASITVDYEFLKRNHLNVGANFANIGYKIFDNDIWISKPLYSGYSLGYGMETLIGPLEIKQSWSPETKNSFTWISVGFWF